MDELDELAEIAKQQVQLQEEHRHAMAEKDWAKATKLQEKIGDLERRSRTLVSGA
jgi:hypothetical protein